MEKTINLYKQYVQPILVTITSAFIMYIGSLVLGLKTDQIKIQSLLLSLEKQFDNINKDRYTKTDAISDKAIYNLQHQMLQAQLDYLKIEIENLQDQKNKK